MGPGLPLEIFFLSILTIGIMKLVALVIKTSSALRRDLVEKVFSLNCRLLVLRILINLSRVQPFKIL